MAQGTIKTKAAKPGSASGGGSKKATPLRPRGSRQIAPKKAKLQTHKKILKKHTAGLAALTEQSLAARAGHLEMLRGGKGDRKKDADKREAEKRAAAGVAVKK
ncbi:uncharacterized protein K452DRAFT_296288 [Aplosporella prunicola CBS 121167]|uniref:Uncharacterized protein n=1 Tax=Aplosporella prunicola CBS 121167 TaxID=1176127 RepID=A0A6A6BMG1_9PEZI|nr:uncharacterized protein K452DRAFT_296288 [Aplosporella prunicola CBS 121167]KAF2144027.1 hypothetical protein K452DRAFT_296288 [Aplosporella prunicola CBS 121167]